jgi:transcriptional regulator with XRE-family HTH domain
LGTQLWRQLGSVQASAEELMRRHRDVPRLQAFRYACGLSQDQAAARYNETTGHRTTLGGTTVNAWETWARGQGGSPPSLSALLILAETYARGSLGVAAEQISAADLIEGSDDRLAPEDRAALSALPVGVSPGSHDPTDQTAGTLPPGALRLVTSAVDVHTALVKVVDGARETLVAVGSRSREPAYLRRIEHVVRTRPGLVHYRILIGPPHAQLLKEHLLALLDARPHGPTARDAPLRMCLVNDLSTDHERFFTASENAAVVVLPSANSPTNFDTALVVDDPDYARRLVEHGQALYGRRVLDTTESIHDLPVLR